MKSMFKVIRKTINKYSLSKKLNVYYTDKIKCLFQIMKEYNKLYERPVDVNINSDELIGFSIGDNRDIFYKNVHIHYCDTPKNTILRISIKQDDDTWRIGDTFSEDNDTMEVFLNYDIEVPGGLRCANTILKNGTWDEYVLDTINDVEKIISNYTRESKFNKEYDHVSYKSVQATAETH